jgi:osmotically-inducible protein OsmY
MTRGRTNVGVGHPESHVRRALAEDPRTHLLDIEVKVIEHHVHLLGRVSSEALRAAAQSVAEEVVEGWPVHNRLTVHQIDHVTSERIR